MTDKNFARIDWENPTFRLFIVSTICLGTYLYWNYRLPEVIDLVAYPDEHDYSFDGQLVYHQVNKWVFYGIYVAGIILTSIYESWKNVFILIAMSPLFFGVFYLIYGHIPI